MADLETIFFFQKISFQKSIFFIFDRFINLDETNPSTKASVVYVRLNLQSIKLMFFLMHIFLFINN